MFTPTELKDLAVMVERYRDDCLADSQKIITTESAKRMYAREILKAEEFLVKIRENVSASAVERYEPLTISALGSNG